MTPLKVQQKLNSLISMVSFVGAERATDYTIIDLTNYAGKVINIIGRIRVTGTHGNADYTKGIIKVNGTVVLGESSWDTAIGGSFIDYAPFSMTIDMNSKTITGIRYICALTTDAGYTESFTMQFTDLTSVACRLQSVNSTNRRTYCDATITVSN